ncbi:unnamed protein product, partial [Mycena citricolor]
ADELWTENYKHWPKTMPVRFLSSNSRYLICTAPHPLSSFLCASE